MLVPVVDAPVESLDDPLLVVCSRASRASCAVLPELLRPDVLLLLSNSASTALCAESPELETAFSEPRLCSSAASASWAVSPALDELVELVVAVLVALSVAALADEAADALWVVGSRSASKASCAVSPVGEGGCNSAANCCSVTLPVLFGSSSEYRASAPWVVPPAAVTACSSSVLEIDPSPLVSICANRLCAS